jgi:acetate---CoA ligase (ADP-forming)
MDANSFAPKKKRMSNMDSFFNPSSIVIFGVSDSPTNLGRIIVENLKRFRFGGTIYPVGARAGHRGDLKIFSGLDEIAEVPELAVILVPATGVSAILNECGKKGIGNVIIETGGFSELSDDKEALEEEIAAIGRRFGMKIIGPNCFGVVNVEKGVVLPFFSLEPEYLKAGPISLASQSGGIFYDACMLSSCENMGLGKLISVGNKLMTTENECLEYFISDPGTSVIGLYLEDFSDGRRFMNLAASTDKPIVLLKANRSPAGREIARFHTAALAGDDKVMSAAMAQVGVTMVRSFREMFDCLKIFSLAPMRGRKLAVISRSGGHSVLAADGASRHGFELARFSEEFFSAVGKKKLNVIRATNPLDVGDVYDIDAYQDILELALKEEGVDGVVFVVTYSPEMDGPKVESFVRSVPELSSSFKKPVTLSIITNKREWFAVKEWADFPVFADSDDAIMALSQSLESFERRISRIRREKEQLLAERRAMAPPRGAPEIVPVAGAFTLLEKYGLFVAEYELVEGTEGAIAAAARIGYPVALKNGSPQMIHKTEKKGVVLNIANPDELRSAAREMAATGYLVQKMYPSATEVIIGVKHDREFGHVVLFGLGGTYVELLRDTAVRVLPIDEDRAGEMIEEVKGSAILKGYRGSRPLDIKALKETLVKVSRLILENPEIETIDMNPVIVLEEGKGAIVLDAKIESRKGS